MLNAALKVVIKTLICSRLRKFVPYQIELNKRIGFETLKYNAVAAQMSRENQKNLACHE
jgi:hypothetical protein